MGTIILVVALASAGEPVAGPADESDQFETWPEEQGGPEPGEVRVVGNYDTQLLKDGNEDARYYVLGDPPQLLFAADGPGLVVLKVRGLGDGEVGLQLDLDAQISRRERLMVVSEYSRELFLRIPAGRHLVGVIASKQVLIRPEKADREPLTAETVVVWEGVAPRRGSVESDFWEYQPDLSGFEWKEKAPPRRWDLWLNAGLGPCAHLSSSTAGLGIGGSANFRIDQYLLLIRYTYNLEMSVLGPEPSESHWEVGPLFGFILKGRAGWISGAAGVGIVGGVKRGKLLEHGDIDEYEEVDFVNVGFPFDVQLFLKPPAFKIFGLGLNIYANLSPDYSVFGAMVAIMVGI